MARNTVSDIRAPGADKAAALRSSWTESAQQTHAEQTQAAYRRDWRVFTDWCQLEGVDWLPALPAQVANYLQAEYCGGWREDEPGKSFATLKRRCASIAQAHRAAKLIDPTKSEEVRLTLRGIARRDAEVRKAHGLPTQHQAAGLNQGDADRITAAVGGGGVKLKDVRDLALLWVGRDLLARASELVSVTIESIRWDRDDDTAQVTLTRTTQDEAPPFQLGPDASEALRRWLDMAGIAAGPVFMGLTKGGKLTGYPLTRHDVGRILNKLAKRALIDTNFSARSLRVGMAQDLVADNIETVGVMNAGGWKSEAMLVRYTRQAKAKHGAISRYYAKRHKCGGHEQS